MHKIICDLCDTLIYGDGSVVRYTKSIFQLLRLLPKFKVKRLDSSVTNHICDACQEKLRRIFVAEPNAVNELRTLIRQQREEERPAVARQPAYETRTRGMEAGPPPNIRPTLDDIIAGVRNR